MKNYSGSDLSREDKKKLSDWIKSIKKVLTEKGCTNLDFHYGFHFISGFFTSSSGQVYYIRSMDTRFSGINLYYRKAKDYSDYRGGYDIHIYGTEELKNCDF